MEGCCFSARLEIVSKEPFIVEKCHSTLIESVCRSMDSCYSPPSRAWLVAQRGGCLVEVAPPRPPRPPAPGAPLPPASASVDIRCMEPSQLVETLEVFDSEIRRVCPPLGLVLRLG